MMELKQIKAKAESLGLATDNKNIKELIHDIQRVEGNYPCFRTAKNFCDQSQCCWRAHCLSPRWLEGARLEEVKEELERLMQTIESLQSTANSLG